LRGCVGTVAQIGIRRAAVITELAGRFGQIAGGHIVERLGQTIVELGLRIELPTAGVTLLLEFVLQARGQRSSIAQELLLVELPLLRASLIRRRFHQTSHESLTQFHTGQHDLIGRSDSQSTQLLVSLQRPSYARSRVRGASRHLILIGRGVCAG
jgi:hypothetical protein